MNFKSTAAILIVCSDAVFSLRVGELNQWKATGALAVPSKPTEATRIGYDDDKNIPLAVVDSSPSAYTEEASSSEVKAMKAECRKLYSFGVSYRSLFSSPRPTWRSALESFIREEYSPDSVGVSLKDHFKELERAEGQYEHSAQLMDRYAQDILTSRRQISIGITPQASAPITSFLASSRRSQTLETLDNLSLCAAYAVAKGVKSGSVIDSWLDVLASAEKSLNHWESQYKQITLKEVNVRQLLGFRKKLQEARRSIEIRIAHLKKQLYKLQMDLTSMAFLNQPEFDSYRESIKSDIDSFKVWGSIGSRKWNHDTGEFVSVI